jgi:glycosyltransferase involved in cell wall biosynthesis
MPQGRDLLYVVGTLQTGGTERHLGHVLPRLAARGWRIRVFRLGEDGPIGDVLRAGGVEIIDGGRLARLFRCLPRPWRGLFAQAANALQLTIELVLRRPTVCHMFLPQACIIGGAACMAALFGRRVASRRSLNHYQRKRPLEAKVERFLMRRMAVCLGNSKAVLADLASEGIAVSRLGLIRNGIEATPYDMAPPPAAARAAHGLSDATFAIGVVANLIPYKGHADLIDALALAVPRLPREWMAFFAGRDDGIGTGLRARAAAAGIDRRIALLGECADVPRFWSAMDVAVSCSHEEGSSNAVIEAMLAGRAVIATAVGGNAEAVVPGKTGLVVPARAPAPLADAILALAADPAVRAELGITGRKLARETYGLDACVQRYERLYLALIGPHVGAIQSAIDDETAFLRPPTSASH